VSATKPVTVSAEETRSEQRAGACALVLVNTSCLAVTQAQTRIDALAGVPLRGVMLSDVHEGGGLVRPLAPSVLATASSPD
jgi:hypothetical protein